jgi:hypothetical protein
LSLEKTLVQRINEDAEAMNCFVAWVGQRRAKGSGTTQGFPDGVLFCNGHCIPFELKREKDADNPAGRLRLDQQVFIEKAAQHGVRIPVIDNEPDFVSLVNSCRRPKWR